MSAARVAASGLAWLSAAAVAAALEVVVVPASDPSGRPWRLEVIRDSDRRSVVSGGAVSLAGRFAGGALPAGRYELRLLAADGSRWLSRSLDAKEGATPLVLEVPILNVRGSVHGTRGPLRGTLVFRDEIADTRVVLTSGEDGMFRGQLPSPRGASWAVEISSDDPPVNHRLEGVVLPAADRGKETWLDLTVPGASARGIVLAEDGQPQANAQVLAERLDDPSQAHAATTDERGCFELRGLPPGDYRVEAEGSHGLSDARRVTVGGDVEPELELVLGRRKRLLSGQVRSPAGPLAGATARVWIAPGRMRAAVSDEEGRFEVQIPDDAEEVQVTAAADGFALRMARVPIAASSSVAIALDTAGGTLVVEGMAEAPAGGSTDELWLTRDGAVESLEGLAEWASRRGGGPDGPRLVIPDVEPGRYGLCRADAREMAHVWSGKIGSGRCTSGTLAPGGRLTLAPK